MGYTHYWKIREPIDADAFSKLAKGIKQIVETAQDAGIAIQDDSTDTIINFNGVGADSHENFVLQIGDTGFDFTKTAGKPYDTAVTASLVLLKKELGAEVVVTSDGGWEDWESGRLLFETVYDENVGVNFLGV
jgi:predicted secreted acid phosphatase